MLLSRKREKTLLVNDVQPRIFLANLKSAYYDVFGLSRDRAHMVCSDPDLHLQNFSDVGSRISAVGNVDNVQGICKAMDITVMN
jgi:hypothetical protein